MHYLAVKSGNPSMYQGKNETAIYLLTQNCSSLQVPPWQTMIKIQVKRNIINCDKSMKGKRTFLDMAT